jgi:hypothetical protein
MVSLPVGTVELASMCCERIEVMNGSSLVRNVRPFLPSLDCGGSVLRPLLTSVLCDASCLESPWLSVEVTYSQAQTEQISPNKNVS